MAYGHSTEKLMNKLQNLYGIAFKNCRLDSILTKICSCWPCSTTPEQLSENWTAATSFTCKSLTFGFTTGKSSNNKHKRFGMLVVLHQLLIQSFKLLWTVFMQKLKMTVNQLAKLYRWIAPKIFFLSIITSKWEYQLLLLMLLKVFKNTSMKIWNKMSLTYKEWTKKSYIDKSRNIDMYCILRSHLSVPYTNITFQWIHAI